MTKIEIEKPVLPKWLDSMVKDIIIYMPKIKRSHLRLKALENNILYKLEAKEINKQQADWFFKNEDKILTALIYGYEVEG